MHTSTAARDTIDIRLWRSHSLHRSSLSKPVDAAFLFYFFAFPSSKAARDYGLVGPVTQPAELSWSFSLFKWDLVVWSALPGVLPVWIGMVFVVAFSSTLDVAAIEIGAKPHTLYTLVLLQL